MHEPTPSRSRSTDPPRGRTASRRVAIVGPGRAGRAVGAALHRAGWPIVAVAGRSVDAASTQQAAVELDSTPRTVAEAGRGAEVIVLATPDRVISTVADSVASSAAPGALVVHLAGSRGLDVYSEAGHRRPDIRFAALHPLVSIPFRDTAGAPEPTITTGWCAVAGDPGVYELAAALGLQPFTVAEDERPRYHAAATIAANHLVVLLSQVERLAGRAGVPLDAFYPLVRGVIDNCEAMGPRAALTGPVTRGDTETVDVHLSALAPAERDLYRALATEALRLSGRDDPVLAERLR